MYRENAALSLTAKDAMIALLKARRIGRHVCRTWLRRCLMLGEEVDIASDHDVRQALRLLLALGFTHAQLIAAYDRLEAERPQADWA